jgi:hypothetical protein
MKTSMIPDERTTITYRIGTLVFLRCFSRAGPPQTVQPVSYSTGGTSYYVEGNHHFKESDAAVKNSSRVWLGLLLIQLPGGL